MQIEIEMANSKSTFCRPSRDSNRVFFFDRFPIPNRDRNIENRHTMTPNHITQHNITSHSIVQRCNESRRRRSGWGIQFVRLNERLQKKKRPYVHTYIRTRQFFRFLSKIPKWANTCLTIISQQQCPFSAKEFLKTTGEQLLNYL